MHHAPALTRPQRQATIGLCAFILGAVLELSTQPRPVATVSDGPAAGFFCTSMLACGELP